MTALYLVWCGLVWVLRGGWFGALCRKFAGFEPGTTLTRIVCAGLMAAPMAFVVGWLSFALWFAIWVAMTVGYFGASMGLTRTSDYPLLAAWGAVVAFISTIPLHSRLTIFTDPATISIMIDPAKAVWSLTGALAVAAYASQKPFDRRFGWDWTERAEALTGACVGAAIVGAAVA